MVPPLLETLQRPLAPWLCLLGVGLFLTADFAVRLRRPANSGFASQLTKLLSAVFLAALAVDGIELVDERFSTNFRIANKIVIVAAAIAAAYLLAIAVSPGGDPGRHARRLGIAALLVSSSSTAWSACRLHAEAFPAFWMHPASDRSADWVRRSEAVSATTDRGTVIPLYEFVSFAAPRRDAGDSPENRSNCHGWVFADSRFIIHSAEVDTILADNGYHEVKQPRGGDIAIYRDARDKTVLHSGLVRGLLDDGTVMIESKWGRDYRYLHAAADQPYSQTFSYLRSVRQGHCLTMRESPRSELPAAPGRRNVETVAVGGVAER